LTAGLGGCEVFQNSRKALAKRSLLVGASSTEIVCARGNAAAASSEAEQVWEIRDGKIARLENKVDQEAWAKGWS
jgi:hypothetical protein